MNYADLGSAVTLGFVVGLCYSEILASATLGDFTYSILNLMYLTCCVLYPIYGYVPETDRDSAFILFSATILAAYLLPALTILLLGVVVSLRWIEVVFKLASVHANGFLGILALSGFMIATQFGEIGNIRLFILLIPTTLSIIGLFPRHIVGPGDIEVSLSVYARNQLLGVRFEKGPTAPEARTRGG